MKGIPKNKFIKTCNLCGNIFETQSNVAKVCYDCKSNRNVIVCKGCGKYFIRQNNTKYCEQCHISKHKCSCGCDDYIDGEKFCHNIRYIKGHGRKNKTTTEEHKNKISVVNKGRKISEDQKEKLQKYNIGRKHSEETKNKMSVTAKKNNFGKWMKGRKLSKEIKEKISNKNKGHVCSEETRKKISYKNSGKNNGMYDCKYNTEKKKILSDRLKLNWKDPIIRKKLMKNISDRCRKAALVAQNKIKNNGFMNTKPEVEMKDILDKLNIKYKHIYEINNIKHCYMADFYCEDLNLIIEVDGKYWHNYPLYRDLDIIRNEELKDAGYCLLRFWENEFDLNTVNYELNKIKGENYGKNKVV